MNRMRAIRPLGLVTALCLVVALLATAGSARAQADETGINFIAFSCPDTYTNLYADCTILNGASYEILADGVPLADSPFTTAPTSLVPGFFFSAPWNATLTVTQLDSTDGSVPASGFDPLVIVVEEIPIGGCGGESTCATIESASTPARISIPAAYPSTGLLMPGSPR